MRKVWFIINETDYSADVMPVKYPGPAETFTPGASGVKASLARRFVVKPRDTRETRASSNDG